MNIRMADSFHWQIGKQVLNDAPFRSGKVTGSENLLDGISFSDPIGTCTNADDVPWIFRPPFVTSEEILNSPENLKLVIKGVDAQLRLQHAGAPAEEVASADELFSDEAQDDG